MLPRLNGRAASQRIVMMSCILLNEVELATLERLGGTKIRGTIKGRFGDDYL